MSRKLVWGLITIALVVGVGIVANPLIVRGDALHDPVGEGILIAIGLVGLAGCVAACVLRLKSWRAALAAGPESDPPVPVAAAWRWPEFALGLLIVGLWVAMFWPRWRDPELSTDDTIYINESRTWATMRANLLTPFAEHLCPMTRVWTWLVCATFDEAVWPRALGTSGLLLFAATFVPLYLFVRREWNSPALALAAVSVFALTPVHSEIVRWYSASQWSWALLLLLTSLLVVQANPAGPTRGQLVASVALAAIGPFFYLVGLLIGPVSAVYLAGRRGRDPGAPGLGLARCALPLVGTALFLIFFVPFKLRGVLAVSSYGGRPALGAIDPLGGVLYSMRSAVDLLILRNLGSNHASLLPRAVYATVFLLAAAATVEFVRRAPRPRPVVLGYSLIVLSYLISLPFRSWVQYDQFLNWTRYQLFPQVGVALVVASALATWAPAWLVAPELTRRSGLCVLALATAQFAIHVLA